MVMVMVITEVTSISLCGPGSEEAQWCTRPFIASSQTKETDARTNETGTAKCEEIYTRQD